ncbi:glutamate racemase [Aquimarina sp. RZ0]|uniref:glutamate racemase n=1 Tax=Aquimarina sp. RZ0 TaxID=2607730 RepID=UPI0011F1A4F6|nr:glutamate racemase [Aquimarina sp. RZ0]KAA1245903.1 glutamate racemase [Aquimarina sp. RZ0]
MNNQAIGIFDSGVGGTSIWQEITIALPNENTIYLADSKYAPYGKRTKEEIIALSIKNTEKLLELNCKIIVVACNTATTNAIKILREQFDIPFIGIEPAIKPAAKNTETKKVGVLATQGTLSSQLFAKTSDLYASTIDVIEVVGTGLVELIEQGKIETQEMYSLLESYMRPMIKKNIDYLVLGCSHYPYLMPILKKILPSNIIIIDSGEAVARQTKVILSKRNILNKNLIQGSHIFHTNGDLHVLQKTLNTKNKSIEIKLLNF